MKIVDLHTCSCPIGHTDLSPNLSLKTKNFIVFGVRFFQNELPFISTRAALYMQVQILKFHLWVCSGAPSLF